MPFTPSPSLPSDSAGLITLEDLKVALNIPDTDTSRDAQFQQAITVASVAIRSFTQRNIGGATVTETRTYNYDGQGWLTIDDATAVASVTLDGTALVPDVDFILGPDRQVVPDAPLIFEWLELVPYQFQSPEMGFMRNLDRLWWRIKRVYKVAVTADFGWAGAVPADVQQAAIDTAVALVSSPEPFIAESIDSYSYQRGQALQDAIPDRAKGLLADYRRYL